MSKKTNMSPVLGQEIADITRRFRYENRLTCKQMAELLSSFLSPDGVKGLHAVYYWEKGNDLPDPNMMELLLERSNGVLLEQWVKPVRAAQIRAFQESTASIAS